MERNLSLDTASGPLILSEVHTAFGCPFSFLQGTPISLFMFLNNETCCGSKLHVTSQFLVKLDIVRFIFFFISFGNAMW